MTDMRSTVTPKVSVIVPVYNVEPYIAKCLSSLMAQTMQELEFILVDDCGSDRSMDIAREYAARDSRFRILEGTENIGSGPSRNRGMEAARGEYLGFVDPDDWVTPDYYQQLYETAVAEQADVAKGRLVSIRDTSCAQNKLNERLREFFKEGRWPGLVFNHCFTTAIYRTEIQRRHHITFPNLRNGQDTVFLTAYLIHVNKVALNDTAIYFYYQRTSSVSHSVNEAFFDALFQNAELRGKLVNDSSLPEADILEYWRHLMEVSILRYSLGHAPKASREFYVRFFAKAQALLLGSGLAQRLYAAYPSEILFDLLVKTPENIVDARLDILPKLERPVAPPRPKAETPQSKASPPKPKPNAPQAPAKTPQPKVSAPPKAATSPPKKSTAAPNLAACAWRYPVYRRRYRYCRFMALLTWGRRHQHYKQKREAYRLLLRDIRHAVQRVTSRRGLPW